VSTFTENGVLYEVTGFGPVNEPGFHYECWALEPPSNGKIGVVIVPEDGGDPIIELEHPVPLSLLRRWLSFIPEGEAGDLTK
jgi:hypothetical protein